MKIPQQKTASETWGYRYGLTECESKERLQNQ